MVRIKKIAVLGAGVMGTSIAAHLANAGLEVLLLDRLPGELTEEDKSRSLTLENPAARNRLALQGLERANKAKPAPFFNPATAERVRPGNFTDHLPELSACDWVVEAVIEDPEAKRELFAHIAPHMHETAILSSNTSGLSVNALAEDLPADLRRRFLVTHFFNPPRYMRLLELVPCTATDPKLVSFLSEFLGRRLGKGIVVGKDTPNFVANRIGVFAMFNAIQHMLEMGLSVVEVDAVAGKATARPKSAVFRTADMVGLDTLVHVGRHSRRALADDEARDVYRIPEFLSSMVERGLIGDKAKAGFYRQEKTAKGKDRLYFDMAAGDYRPVQKPDFPSVKAAEKLDDPALRLRVIMDGDDPAAEFAWRNLRDTLLYAVNRIPEITDRIEQIDNAMKWGFNWELGPFEMLDAFGVESFVRRAERDGLSIADSLKRVPSFYKIESGKEYAWDLVVGQYREVPKVPGQIRLDILKQSGKKVEGNENASLLDLGDGVFGLEFHSKMNSISPDMLDLLRRAVARTEAEGAGLVVGNQGPVFSAGANLGVLAAALGKGTFTDIEKAVAAFQQASMALKYAQVPVVAAPFDLTLGGACEFCLHADAIVAHAETYMGLVEVGAGILPAGGGCKELTLRALRLADQYRTDVSPFLFKAFENIGMAKVSSSAEELFSLGYLRHGDAITMDLARLLADAKNLVLTMASTYRPSSPATQIKAPGRSVAASMKSRLWNLAQGRFISDYDRTVGGVVADVLCGGDVPSGTLISEEYLLELEREGFLRLVGNPQTRQRIEHLLKTGKPLRN